MIPVTHRALALSLTFAYAASLAALSPAALAETSFEGKTVNIIINSKPGGGTDATARFVGNLLPAYLPGNPQVTFQNLPGGGGIKANNYFYAKAEPDGMTMLVGSRTQISPSKLRHKAVKYNPADYRFVGGTVSLGTLVLIHKSELPRLGDPKARPLAFAGIDGERSGTSLAAWGKAVLGWNLKFVLGYPGTSEMLMAARRQETDMAAIQNAYAIAPMIKDGMVPLAQVGQLSDDGRMLPRTAFPEVPVFDDMIRPKLPANLTGAYRAWMNDQLVDKWMALPPKTPDALVETHRKAYAQVMKDPKFLTVVKREFGEDFDSYSGKAMERIVEELSKTSDEDLQAFLKLRQEVGLPATGRK